MENIKNKINKLKKDKNAVILAHNYQRPEVQDIADYVGDSLGLSLEASKTRADIIVFCGVNFMAETAAIICPDKKVIMPDANAGCPMANMIKAEDVRKLRAQHPGYIVVAYVNTSAEVKAESDYCCTSANAEKIVEKLKDKDIIFIPDKYLGDYVSGRTGKKMVLYNGFCPTHVRILPEHILAAKKQHPEAVVIVHPECLPETIKAADKVASTGGMVKFVKGSPSKEFIIGTETGMIHRLKKENPSKMFYPATELASCPNMKITTLEKVLWSLEEEKTVITVPAKTASKARVAIDRMIKAINIFMVLLVLSCGSLAAERKFASTYISEGIANYEQENYLESILKLRAAEQLSPNPVTVYKYLGMSYSKLALWRQAVKEFNKILFVSPDDPERAQIVSKMHEWERQTEHIPMMAKYSYYSIKYKNKIWEEPDNLLNYLSLTEIYICSGRYEEAENFFRALVKDRPDKMDFKKYLAEVYFLDNKYGEAGNLYRKILEEDPLNTDAIIGLNLVLKKRYEDILAMRPSNMVTYIKLARVFRDMKRLEDAISTYEKYLERDSANIEVRREMEETRKLLQAVSPGYSPR